MPNHQSYWYLTDDRVVLVTGCCVTLVTGLWTIRTEERTAMAVHFLWARW